MSTLDPKRQREFAFEVVEKLRQAGFVAYWAGGCVRDQLLGRTPKDYDVATSARPEAIPQLFGHRRTLPIGEAFGVITVLGPKPAGQVEVATFRQDAAYSDGRHPDAVTFSTPEEDAQRRDFTINGLFYDPVEKQVIDFVGGEDDLRRGIVRAIGDPAARIEEDKLRMLRAVRFAATFDFALDADTLAAVRDRAEQINVVSAERIGSEMRRMLIDTHRARATELLRASRLLEVLLPELRSMCGDTESQASEADDAWQETLRVLEALAEPSLAVALAALVHRAEGDAVAASVARRMKFTNKEIQRAQWLLDNFDQIAQATEVPWPKLQRLLVTDGIDELIALYEATTSPDDVQLVHCRARLALPPEELNPPPLLNGDDLIIHGVRRGRVFRELLETLRDAQLEHEISTREEAFALVDRLLGEMR